jgi:hypothetical protein
MSREDIIRMAREAGFETAQIDIVYRFAAVLDDFAAIVAAQEREACAKVCDAHTVDDVLVGVGIGQSCAAAIRARSQP